MNAELPQDAVEITFERVFCPRHGEPYRAQWPTGYALSSVKLFQVTARHVVPLDGETFKDAHARTFDEKPMCCHVTPDEMRLVYVESGIGLAGHCWCCHRRRLGAPFSTKTTRYGHVCFECVLYRFEEV